MGSQSFALTDVDLQSFAPTDEGSQSFAPTDVDLQSFATTNEGLQSFAPTYENETNHYKLQMIFDKVLNETEKLKEQDK